MWPLPLQNTSKMSPEYLTRTISNIKICTDNTADRPAHVSTSVFKLLSYFSSISLSFGIHNPERYDLMLKNVEIGTNIMRAVHSII